MHTELARAALEDQPALLGLGVLDVGPAEHVAEERSRGFRVVGIDERVKGREHAREGMRTRRGARRPRRPLSLLFRRRRELTADLSRHLLLGLPTIRLIAPPKVPTSRLSYLKRSAKLSSWPRARLQLG